LTDGIIQKVCRGWDNVIAREIEVQLIEEIKSRFRGHGTRDTVIRRILIGDTK